MPQAAQRWRKPPRTQPAATDGANRATPWHARSVDEVLGALEVERDAGLTGAEARQRLGEHGPNQLEQSEARPWWRILQDQFKSIVVYLLAAAAALALATGRWPEGIAVLAVILVNTAIGHISELRAVRSMAALRRLSEHTVCVRRGGDAEEIAATELVPGDIVLLEAGALVPADLRLIEARHLRVNEAALTGESVPADKTIEAIDVGASLSERSDMLYKGTSIAQGEAIGVVVTTGMQTELGRIAQLAETAQAAVTPLQRRLDALGRRLAWLTIGIAAALVAIGFLVGRRDPTLIIETALALGIAAIPEGLPIVATIALARGMVVMARRNALVNRLTAVETLGATRVIFSDKTGTLTENRMRLAKAVTDAGEMAFDEDGRPRPADDGDSGASDSLARRVVELGVLCNAASLGGDEDQASGDPTEIALLVAGRALDIERDALLDAQPQVRIEEFDPRSRKMATFHRHDDAVRVAVKGAPGAVLDICDRVASADDCDTELDDGHREQWRSRMQALAGQGLRVLAMAEKRVDAESADPYEALCLVGLVGLLDPPREGVKEAIDKCQAAGIRVEMVTGDQPQTARAIAEAVGIVGDEDDPETVVMLGEALKDPEQLDEEQRAAIHRANIFARVSPEQKLNLVRLYQDRGEIVAMTGDGVNDAPALKKADIGVAMGLRGTDAAKQTADMVLKDDALESVVAAVEHGRVIFTNIRRSVLFMLCTNVAEVLAVTVATLAGWTLPLRPLQILYLNVLTDVFPALALGVGPGSGMEMRQPPRDPNEAVLTRRHWIGIAGWAVLIAACVLAGLLLAQRWLGLAEAGAVTVSFLILAFGKLWFTFNLRSPLSNVIRNEITRNRWVWGALALCSALLVAAVYVPPLSRLLQTQALDGSAWGLVLGMSMVPLAVGQVVREVQRRRHDR